MSRKIFISFCSKDNDKAKEIFNYIREKKEDWDIFWSNENLRAGDKFNNQIRSAIVSSDYFLILFSENSVNSRWVWTELGIAIALMKKIIPIALYESKKLESIPLPFINYQNVQWLFVNNQESYDSIIDSIENDLKYTNPFIHSYNAAIKNCGSKKEIRIRLFNNFDVDLFNVRINMVFKIRTSKESRSIVYNIPLKRSTFLRVARKDFIMLQSESNKKLISQERSLSDWNKILEKVKKEKNQINIELLISYSMSTFQETCHQFIEWSSKEKLKEGIFKYKDAECIEDSILNIDKFSEIINDNTQIGN